MSLTMIGYSGLHIFVIIATVLSYRNGLSRLNYSIKTIKKRAIILILAFVFWTLYLYFIGESGVLWNFDLPPRFLLFVFLPFFIMVTYVLVRYRNSQMFHVISKEKAIYFQSFRIIVELVILATYLEGIFPIETTFEGYNFEIIIGLIAPLVAYAVYRKKWIPESYAMLFNICGIITLGIIIFIVISALFFPVIWGDNVPEIKEEFTRVPYLLLPGLLAPMAIFVHVFSIMQIRKSRILKN